MEDLITFDKEGRVSSISGPNGYRVMQVSVLISSLALYQISEGRIIPSRGVTLKKMLDMATVYTGQVYKRTEIDKAKQNLNVWLETMKSAIPVEVR